MLLAKNSQDFFPALFNDLFDFNGDSSNFPSFTTPRINVKENQEAYNMELSVPGLTKDDLNIFIDNNNNLVVEMTKKTETKNDDSHYLRHEFSTTQFKEMMSLPENINADDIQAKVENGILNICLPKLQIQESKNSIKQIDIQ